MSRLIGAWITCIVLIPLAVFGLYAIQVASDHLMRKTLEELQRSVLIDTDKLKHVFDMAQGDLPILSKLPTVQGLAWARAARDEAETTRWLKAVGQAFLTFSNSRRVYNQIRYLDEDGWEVVRVDRDGTNPPRLIPRDELQNKRERDYFSETMTLGPGQVFVSPLNLNREDGQIEMPYRSVIRYATPFFDDAGSKRGIVIINLMVGPLLDAVYQEGKAAQKEMYAVDQEGFYLLHSDPAKQWGGPHDLNTGERLQWDFPDLATKLLSRQAGATVTGKHVIASQLLTLSQSSPNPSLVIVERIPTSIVLAAIADLRLYLLIILVGVGGAAVGGAVLIGKRLARPVGDLATAADRISQGDLDTRVVVGGPMEIAVLGETFNRMADNLVQARSQTERQVAELAARQRVVRSILQVVKLEERLSIALEEILALLEKASGTMGSTSKEQSVRVAIYMMEVERPVLRLQRGLSKEFLALARELPLETCPWARTATVVHAPWEPTDPITEALRREGVMAWASLPMMVERRWEGMLLVADTRTTALDPEMMRALSALVDEMTVAFYNARLYEELRLAAIQLEARVEDRTRELKAANVQQEAASRHKSEFLANMSHELRTPLNAILGFSELLQDPVFGPLTEKQGRYVGHIHSSGQHLLALINDILDLSKVEAGKLALRPEAFVLHEALTAALTEIRFQAEAKQLQIELQVDPALTTLTADPVRLKQIVLNLLSNAVKFTPEGGAVTVTARMGRTADPEVRRESGTTELVEIAVRDTGIGIKAEDLPKLFQPFTQLESPFTKRHQGTGLGLALTKQLVELHGGTIWAESEGQGKGSRFAVLLPMAGPRGSPRLLLLEDDEAFAETVRDWLQAAGYQVDTARDGATALAQVAAIMPDLIILDLRLPVVDGWEVLRQLRANPSTRSLPILTITSVDVQLAEEALTAGADEFLATPFSLTVLESTIGRLLRGGGRHVGQSGARRSGTA